ncbi:MAG TPA: ribonuclease H-like domain-containing protein [Spirochaetales bacterium]|nr:ribonuclease H-like domain-containing protein [Spirochaetales bacterium]
MAKNLKGRLARLRELGLVKAAELEAPGAGEKGAFSGGAAEGEAAAQGGAPVGEGGSTSPSARRRPGAGARGARAGGGERPGVPSFLAGWTQAAELVWERELRFPSHLPPLIDPRPFAAMSRKAARGSLDAAKPGVRSAAKPGARAADGAAPLGAGGRPEAATRGAGLAGGADGLLPSESLRFFDLETTGLSGGSGTVAFLAAVGRIEAGEFAVRQLFLADYPGERAWLEALLSLLSEGSVVTTYNGRAFDLPLLRTRLVMNGMRPPSFAEIDALFVARRLWRRVHGGASLSLLERLVLDLERELDVPGSAIPDIWFSYLREGDHPLMAAAMAHNAEDVSGLERLAARAARIFEEPRAWAASGAVDRAGLGRGLLALGRADEGEELLEAALGEGDAAAGLLLSRRYRREGRLEDRRRVVGMLPEGLESCVERAKFHEHALKDFRAALAWTDRAISWAREGGGTEAFEALEARRARLLRKLERGG